jgi:glycosyltransferase involved in cell wall biosynthesis
MKEKITACIIVKDEEDNLPICLHSIRNYCDQIVVVDTGSSDKTPVIATRYGAEVYFHQWQDDFSEARNFALSHARNPWILSVDADEYLEKFQIDEKLLNDKKVGGINLKIINFLDNDPKGPRSEHRYTRLFRNDPQIRFEGSIHEQIRESIEKKGLEIKESDLAIYHTGYINTSNEKRKRNRDMLEKETQKNKDDWNIFHLAESEFSLKNNEKAKELYDDIKDSTQLNIDQKDKVKVRLGQIALNDENYSEVESLLNFQANDTDMEGLRKFVLAASYLNKGAYEEAQNLYKSTEIKSSSLVDQNIVNKALQILEQIQ